MNVHVWSHLKKRLPVLVVLVALCDGLYLVPSSQLSSSFAPSPTVSLWVSRVLDRSTFLFYTALIGIKEECSRNVKHHT